MAIAEQDRSPVIIGTAREGVRGRIVGTALAANSARTLWAAGYIFLMGSIADVMLLWTMQRQVDPGWEFASLAATIEGTPRIALAVALIMAGNFVRGTTSVFTHRLFAVLLLVLGVAGAVIGALILSDYFVVRRIIRPEEQRLFLSTVLKSLTLAALHVMILVPVGVLGLRRTKA